MGNRTAKTDMPASLTSNFSYDNIYQLTQVTQGANTPEAYTYDTVGNRLTSAGSISYNYNSSNHLTASTGVTYTYDNNGNTVTKVDAVGTTTYAWDYENRLTSVTLPNAGGTVSFTYDPLGRRIRKIFGSATTIYTYDAANIVAETDASGAVVARYAQGPGIDRPLAMLRNSATHFYNADGLGSITSLTDSSGSVAATYTYDSFGNLTASSGSLTNPFRYTAREWDSEASSYFYRARYYSSSAGRFLGEDPFGQYQMIYFEEYNLYAYALNNPINFVDPTGMQMRADTPNMESPIELMRELGRKRREERARGEKDPIVDVFAPCFMKCMILGFADDVATGLASLAFKKVRDWLKTPLGKCTLKVVGGIATAGAAAYCTNRCKNKVYEECPPCSNKKDDSGQQSQNKTQE